MQLTKISDYRGRLAKYHKKILEDHDPLRIAGSEGDVVVMAASDYENLIENLYILKDKVTMNSLLNSRRDMAQKTFSGLTVEEAFDDLMDNQNKQTSKRRSRLV